MRETGGGGRSAVPPPPVCRHAPVRKARVCSLSRGGSSRRARGGGGCQGAGEAALQAHLLVCADRCNYQYVYVADADQDAGEGDPAGDGPGQDHPRRAHAPGDPPPRIRRTDACRSVAAKPADPPTPTAFFARANARTRAHARRCAASWQLRDTVLDDGFRWGGVAKNACYRVDAP